MMGNKNGKIEISKIIIFMYETVKNIFLIFQKSSYYWANAYIFMSFSILTGQHISCGEDKK